MPARAEIPKDVVVMAKLIDDIVSLDPAEAYEFSDEEAIANLYDHLLDYDPAHPEAIRGVLAKSWSVDPDGMTYRFVLRPEAHFASGRPVTAEDAAFSLRRVVLLDLTPAFVLRQFGFTRENVASRIRAEGSSTLVIDTAVRVAPSLLYYVLTSSIASVVDETEAMAHQRSGDLGHQWLADHSAGSGPYRLRAWRPGERYVLDAVPDAWDGPAKNREVIVLDVPEPATQRLMLVRGDADYARDLDKDELAALERDPDMRFDRALQSMQTYFALNQRNPDLRKPEVIEAMKYLVDYDAIAKGLLGGTRVVHQSIVPDGILGALDGEPYHYDLARARSLLAEAGLSAGFDVGVDVTASSPWIDIAEALQASFAPAGVRLSILPGDEKETLTKYRARKHDIYLGEWGSDYPDPHSNAQAFVVDDDMSDNAALKTLAWRNSWQDKGLAQQVAAAEQEPDIDKRAALYRAIEAAHQKVAPFVMMFQDVSIAAHRPGISGFTLGASPDHTLYAGIEKR
ncbi:MAG TPA: ABC transporter substrate-binding protein [Stellaceae bacterium]|nr:ABC transporter substrate-binding protein [Stellaceae bacterium]